MVDWQALLEPHHVLENVVRATLIYWMLFLLLRLLPNRKTGGIGPTDLLVVVLLANAVQTAMMRDSTAITDAAIQVFTIIGWSTAFDALGAHVTEEELDTQLRLQHIDDASDVAHAYVEHDGRVSVIRKRDQAQRGRKPATPKRRGAA